MDINVSVSQVNLKATMSPYENTALPSKVAAILVTCLVQVGGLQCFGEVGVEPGTCHSAVESDTVELFPL